MTAPYDSSFYKVTSETDLPPNRPMIYRAAGATVVLRRGDRGIEAIDGSCLTDDQTLSPAERLRKIEECVAAGVGSTSTEWSELVRRAGLPVKVSNGEVWVCLDACSE